MIRMANDWVNFRLFVCGGYRKSPNKRRVSVRCRVSNRHWGSRSTVQINARGIYSGICGIQKLEYMQKLRVYYFDSPCRYDVKPKH